VHQALITYSRHNTLAAARNKHMQTLHAEHVLSADMPVIAYNLHAAAGTGKQRARMHLPQQQLLL
jgi:hypothetical protein